jgi:hypothetical protein
MNAQTTAFIYHGTLTDSDSAATRRSDFVFRLFGAVSGGLQIGGDAVRDDVEVTNGNFTVDLDFGSSPFTSTTGRYLEIAVRAGASTGAFTTLMPRHAIPSPPAAPQTGANVSGNRTPNGALDTEYRINVMTPSLGLRVQTDTPGSTVASFGGYGTFQVDALAARGASGRFGGGER